MVKTLSLIVLMLAAGLLLLYPLWGVLSPEGFRAEVQEQFPYASAASAQQIATSAAMLWASNGVLALAFVALAGFIMRPEHYHRLTLSGGLLLAYPLVLTAVEIFTGIHLATGQEDVQVNIELSTDKALFLVFGVAILGVSKTITSPSATQPLAAP